MFTLTPKLDALLDKFTKDAHVPVALIIFAVTSAYHFWTHIDLGPQYCTSLIALYGFLGGHAYVSNKNNGNGNGNGTPKG
jgi:hypothetical protein